MKKAIQKITSEHVVGEGAIKNFLWECINTLKIGDAFHPDTSFSEYYTFKNKNLGVSMFTNKECKALTETMNECFAEAEKLGIDIYEIGMDIFKAQGYIVLQ